MLGQIFTIGALVIGAAMLADALANPKGTQAAGSAISSLWKPSLQAAAGQKIS